MKKLIGLALGTLAAIACPTSVSAETLTELSAQARIQECLSDWSGLNTTLSMMVTHPDATTEYINQIEQWRLDYRNLWESQAVIEFDDSSECAAIVAQAEPSPVQAAFPPVDETPEQKRLRWLHAIGAMRTRSGEYRNSYQAAVRERERQEAIIQTWLDAELWRLGIPLPFDF